MAKKVETTIETQAEEVKIEKKAAKQTKVDMSLRELRKEYALMRINMMAGKEANSAKLRSLRKQIARVMMNLKSKVN